MVGEGFLADDPTAAQAQKFQHLIFFIGQIEWSAMNGGLSRMQIQCKFAEFWHIFSVTIDSAHQRLKSCDQILGMQRLG